MSEKKFLYELELRIEAAEAALEKLASTGSKQMRRVKKAAQEAVDAASPPEGPMKGWGGALDSLNKKFTLLEIAGNKNAGVLSGIGDILSGIQKKAASLKIELPTNEIKAFVLGIEQTYAQTKALAVEDEKRVASYRKLAEYANQVNQSGKSNSNITTALKKLGSNTLSGGDSVADRYAADKRAKGSSYVDSLIQSDKERLESSQKISDAQDRHTERLKQSAHAAEQLNKKYADPESLQAIKDKQLATDKFSESLKSQGLTAAQENKEMRRFDQDATNSLSAKLKQTKAMKTLDAQASKEYVDGLRKRATEDDANNNKRYNGNARINAALQANADVTKQKLVQLESDLTGMTAAQAKERIAIYKREAAARQQGAIGSGYDMINKDRANASKYGKLTSGVFQAQQAFEDFQYAGLRGAANNVASMAATFGGPAGIAALAGIFAVQLASSAGVMDKLVESAGGLLGKTKEQLDVEKQIQTVRNAKVTNEVDSKVDMANFNPLEVELDKLREAVAEEKNKHKIQQEAATDALQALNAYTKAKEAASRLPAVEMPDQINWDMGLRTEAPEDVMKNLDAYKKALQPYKFIREDMKKNNADVYDPKTWKFMDDYEQAFRDVQVAMESMQQTDYSPNAAGAVSAKEAFDSFGASIEKLNVSLRDTKAQMDIIDSMSESLDHLKRLGGEKVSSVLDGPKGEMSSKFNKAEQSAEEAWQTRKLKLMTEANIKIKEAAGNQQEVLKITQELEKSLGRAYTEEFRKVIKAQEFYQFAQDTYDLAQKREKQLEKELETLERIVEKENDRISAIDRQESAYADAAAKRQLSLQEKHADFQTKNATSAVDKQFDTGKSRATEHRDRLLAQADQRASALKGMGYKGVDEQLQAFKSSLNQQYEAFVQNEERTRDKLKEGIEKKAQMEKQARLDKHIAEQRVKLDTLKGQAKAAKDGGNFEQAKHILEKAETTLKELTDAADSDVGKGDDAASAKAIENVKKLDAEMQTIFKEQQAVSQAEIANAKLREQEVIQQLERTKQLKLEAGAVDVTNEGDRLRIQQINTELLTTLQLKQQIAAIGMMGSGGGGGVPVAGGRGAAPLATAPGIAPAAMDPTTSGGTGSSRYNTSVNASFSAGVSPALVNAGLNAFKRQADMSRHRMG